MKTFRELTESVVRNGPSLDILDIDDTLFTTGSLVHIKKNGLTIHKLTPKQFNTYVLKAGESYDYGEFTSSHIFSTTAKPIRKVFNMAKAIIEKSKIKIGSKVIILTARSNFDNKQLFLDTFKKFGFDINSVRVERAGNLKLPAHEAKAIIIQKYLRTHKYSRVRLYDDSVPNLIHFLHLKKQFPDVVLEAYLIKNSGTIKRFRGIA